MKRNTMIASVPGDRTQPMSVLVWRSLHGALLGACVSLVHAAELAPAACPSLEAASTAWFSWDTQLSALPAPSVRHRIALWGDSLTASRDFLDAALEQQGIAAAAVQPSYIPAGIAVAGLRLPVKNACASAGWQSAFAHKEQAAGAGFSKGLVSMRADRPGETIALDFRFPTASTRVAELIVLYDKPHPDSALVLGVAVDGGAERLIPLSRSEGHRLRIRPELPMASLRLRLVAGSITLHGFAPRYQSQPAALADVMSLPGGLLRAWSNADARWFAEPAGAAAGYSLIVLEYGTNEGAAAGFSRDKYLAYLRSNLSRLRSFAPRARCVLIGPPDRGLAGMAGPPASLRYAMVHRQIALAQRQISPEFGCEFWDWQAAMGGPGSAVRWAALNPPLMQQDLIHLTSRGYRLSGRMFADALQINAY